MKGGKSELDPEIPSNQKILSVVGELRNSGITNYFRRKYKKAINRIIQKQWPPGRSNVRRMKQGMLLFILNFSILLDYLLICQQALQLFIFPNILSVYI